MPCHVMPMFLGFFPFYSPYPASLNVKQHQSHHFPWFVVRILTFRMQTPAPPKKKTFNSHCILLFCGLHPLRSIPPRLPRPLAPPWLPVRLRPADAQQTHRFAAEQLFILLVFAQLPRSGSGRKRLELWGRAELRGRWWKVMEGTYKDHWDIG